MNNKLNKTNLNENKLYNNLVSLSRNKLLYTKFNLNDTFQNRITLIFIHISFLFIKVKQKNGKKLYENFYQKMFDFVFIKIEENMREIGWGDVTVNKSMKYLVKVFYNILIYCEKYDEKEMSDKRAFLNKHLVLNKAQNNSNNNDLVEYFDKYLSFCIDLSSDSVLKGDLNFKYK